MRYKITLQYDGGGYHGWQRQPKEPLTVQEAVERALEKVTGVPTKVTGSGRTDEGVHALGQTAHFDADKELPEERYLAALNHWLPSDIRVISCERAEEGFDARKSAKRKTYEYRMYLSPVENPLRRTRELWLKSADVGRMDEAARLFIGEHDFSAFMSSGSSAKTTTRTVYAAGVRTEGDSIVFSVTGNGFLYNMVRIMAGAIIRVGGGESDDFIKNALSSGDRTLVPDIAPPYALYLANVEYAPQSDKKTIKDS